MKQLETNKDPKSTIIFHCNLCNYTTCKKRLYERHLTTVKHKKLSNETNETNMKQNSSTLIYINFELKETFYTLASNKNDNTCKLTRGLTQYKHDFRFFNYFIFFNSYR